MLYKPNTNFRCVDSLSKIPNYSPVQRNPITGLSFFYQYVSSITVKKFLTLAKLI